MNLKTNKRYMPAIAMAFLMLFTACGGTASEDAPSTTMESAAVIRLEEGDSDTEEITDLTPEHQENLSADNGIIIQAGGQVFTATLADNSSAQALKEKLSEGPITIDMRDYESMEKVGSLGFDLPQNNEEITTEAGDLILYQGNSFVIYYAPNSWSLTRLGRINNATAEELRQALGAGDVTVTISLPAGVANDTVKPSPKMLVTYFSCTGNTRQLAEYAADALGAELYEIVPGIPYTDIDLDYRDQSSRSSIEMSDDAARPTISGNVENMEEYDIVFLAYPIWFGEAPRIINTFLESYDFSDKMIIPFCTSGSSGIGSSDTNLHGLCSENAVWVPGERFGGADAKDALLEWMNSLDLENE